MNELKKGNNTFLSKNKLILIGILISVLFWIVESAIHTLMVQEGSFLTQLFFPGAHEIWMRLLVIIVMISFCYLIQRSVNKQKLMAETLEFERNQLFSIYNSLYALVVVIDPQNHEIVFTNEAFKEVFGKDLISAFCYKVIEGRDIPCENCDNEKLLQDPSSELIIEHENPTIKKKLMVFKRIIKWFDGRDVIFEVAMDVTDLKHAEKALRESESQKTAILDGMMDLVAYYTKPDMRIAWVNRAAAESLGLSMGQIVGKHCYELWSQDKTPCKSCPVVRAFSTGQPEETERTTSDKSWLIRAYPVKDKKGQVMGIVEVTRDITVQKKYLRNLEYEVQEKTSELQIETDRLQKTLSNLRITQERLVQSEKLASIGFLTAGIAHEINNPLMGIINYAQIVIDELMNVPEVTLDKKPFSFLANIVKEGERIAEIVRGLLTFAREDRGSYNLVDISEIIDSAISLLSPRFKKYLIDVQFNSSKKLVKIPLKKHNIQQVFFNILQNATDALNEKFGELSEIGDKTISITISSIKRTEQKYLKITIRDNGQGIKEENLPHIFDPFFTTKLESPEHGIGLGLSITYGIIKDHGGDIEIHSKWGEYSVVRIYLPLDHSVINNLK